VGTFAARGPSESRAAGRWALGTRGRWRSSAAQWFGLARLVAWSPRIETRGPRTSRVDLKIRSERSDDGLEARSQPCPMAAWHVFLAERERQMTLSGCLGRQCLGGPALLCAFFSRLPLCADRLELICKDCGVRTYRRGSSSDWTGRSGHKRGWWTGRKGMDDQSRCQFDWWSAPHGSFRIMYGHT
jgi:hypothetical protein